MLTLNKQLKENTYSNLYLLYGDEEYLKINYRDRLTSGILADTTKGNINYHLYRQQDATAEAIAEQALCLPFFADRQLLVVENSNLFKAASSLADTLADIPDSTYIIFVENNVDKRNNLFRLLKKSGTVSEINHKKDSELLTWIAMYLKHSDCLITMRAAKLILSKCGVDMYQLSNELEKLISYVGEKKQIDIAEVEAVCTTTLSSRIFLMMDYIVSGKQAKALDLYRELLLTKEPPGKILSLLTKHISALTSIKEMTRENDMDIAKKLSVPSFTVKKYRAQASVFKKNELLACLTACVNTDFDIKTGKIQAQTAIEMLIISLSSGIYQSR